MSGRWDSPAHIYIFVQSVGGVGVRKWSGTSRVLSDAEINAFISSRSGGCA